jgi:hypothetical protein
MTGKDRHGIHRSNVRRASRRAPSTRLAPFPGRNTLCEKKRPARRRTDYEVESCSRVMASAPIRTQMTIETLSNRLTPLGQRRGFTSTKDL